MIKNELYIISLIVRGPHSGEYFTGKIALDSHVIDGALKKDHFCESTIKVEIHKVVMELLKKTQL